jgi:hypothetical protein
VAGLEPGEAADEVSGVAFAEASLSLFIAEADLGAELDVGLLPPIYDTVVAVMNRAVSSTTAAAGTGRIEQVCRAGSFVNRDLYVCPIELNLSNQDVVKSRPAGSGPYGPVGVVNVDSCE